MINESHNGTSVLLHRVMAIVRYIQYIYIYISTTRYTCILVYLDIYIESSSGIFYYILTVTGSMDNRTVTS